MFGRFMLPDQSEHPSQISGLTADGAEFVTELEVPVGVQIVAYIDEIGRVEGAIDQKTDRGFTVKFQLTEARKERIASRIDWLNNNESAVIEDHEQRRHPRFEPQDSNSHITLPDGRIYKCEVIDISLSGAALKTEIMPAMGTYLLLGKMRGRVVRYHDNGFALEFASPTPDGAASA